MGEFDVGQPIPRTEDPRLLTGGGRYSDDYNLPHQLRGYVLRSPYAHADILSIDLVAASHMAGVHAILTADDYRSDGHGDLKCGSSWNENQYQPPNPPLALARVRHVGEAVVFVIADTVDQAKDAAEAIIIDYAELPSNTDTAIAMNDDTPAVWDDRPNNECFHEQRGYPEETRTAFEKADIVVERKFPITRTITNTIEPRSYLGEYNSMDHRYTLYTGCHYPHKIREQMALEVFHVAEQDVRVIAGDVGGSFGLRGSVYPEQVLVMWGSQRLGKPIKWTAERSESHLCDYQGRDNYSVARLAMDKEGNFLGMHVRTLAALGAFVTTGGNGPPINNLGTLAGTYRTPAIHVEVSGVFTNTTPTCPYRGAGRPEAAYIIETLVEAAAQELKRDPAELRRQNTIPADAMPFKTGLVFTYDCGEFEKNLTDALTMINYNEFDARRAKSQAIGKLRGLGISNTIERAGGPSMEEATVRIDKTGNIMVMAGTISQGQGHDTVYKQIVAEKLGVGVDRIRVREGDTDMQGIGGGTGGSRSATCGGSAVYQAALAAIDKAKKLAAHELEASVEDLEYANSSFTIAGTDRSITLAEVAKLSYVPGKQPEGVDAGIDERSTFSPKTANYPNGAHACEVEIDPDTGVVDIQAYVIVDDVGTVLNPLLLKGQIHGGVAQGVGQAVMERAVFDGNGQNVTGSFMDYAMPRAQDFTLFEVKSNPVPTKQNPLGVKGAGEAGTVGALPAVMNAIEHALRSAGVEKIDMPASPERIWAALRAAS
ncbi:MAG: Carbon monoxide dehydrogenase large chain [Alphaproteobacteria bacterium MarineAlpha11_Bin1]|nr:MAG: Carbon monoxide dehydrogenase large chain [Alphaproteobacteria bacterium MarineAlpha11_Bin1]|tara:strand:- start:771 stop:3077 length:2307 start_codon:yes stop_codon:yes gene_type:complete